jgi:lysophospholipase L1-like esterase
MNLFNTSILGGLVLIFSFNSCSQNNNETPVAHTIIPDSIYPPDNILISTHSDWTRYHYLQRIATFRADPLQPNDIVFLGNSITEQGGDWAKKMDNPKAKNRGIAGDTTEGLLARLGEVIYFKPSQVFLLIGINDMFQDQMTPTLIHQNIIEIVNKIHLGSPNTEIFVQTILPTSTVSLIDKINNTNTLILNSARKEPFMIISLHDEFKLNGSMNMNLSVDGIHLNENGYAVWVNSIRAFVD